MRSHFSHAFHKLVQNQTRMQVTIKRMSQSKTARIALTLPLSIGLCLLFATGSAKVHAQSTGPAQQKQPSGAGTATDSSPVAGAQQNLYNASGKTARRPRRTP